MNLESIQNRSRVILLTHKKNSRDDGNHLKVILQKDGPDGN